MYYDNPHIQARLLEFMGGTSPEDATARFITADGADSNVRYRPRAVCEFRQCLADNLDVARSLWDHQSVIAHLDIEYVNFDRPGLAWSDPQYAFGAQQHVADAVQSVLANYGISALHLLSGRGHHFVWGIDRSSDAYALLTEIGYLPKQLAARYSQPLQPLGETIGPALGKSWNGIGLLMEFIGHSVLHIAGDNTTIPITFTAVNVPPGRNGREAVSFDLSEYGDPLHTRGIRMPFSRYLKPRQQSWRLDNDTLKSIPDLFPVPIGNMDTTKAIRVMRDQNTVIELAADASVRIPDCSVQMEELIEGYRHSNLATYHRWFYREEHDPPDTWSDTYDRTPFNTLPPCVRIILEEPNEKLLKPAGIQHVVRTLMAHAWHPRHIAGLIRSRYERDYGWGEQWYRYSATSRADFYARVFSALFVTGQDSLKDFNCDTMQARNDCPVVSCGRSLDDLRTMLNTEIDSCSRQVRTGASQDDVQT